MLNTSTNFLRRSFSSLHLKYLCIGSCGVKSPQPNTTTFLPVCTAIAVIGFSASAGSGNPSSAATSISILATDIKEASYLTSSGYVS